MKKIGPLILLIVFLALGITGCSLLDYPTDRQTPLDIAIKDPAVQDFMNQHLDAKVLLDYYPESEIEAILPLIRSQCNDETIDTEELYKITLIDEKTNEKIATWISWREKKIECVI